MLRKVFKYTVQVAVDLAVTRDFPKGDLICSLPLSTSDYLLILKPVYGCVHNALLFSVLLRSYILKISLGESGCCTLNSTICVQGKKDKLKVRLSS